MWWMMLSLRFWNTPEQHIAHVQIQEQILILVQLVQRFWFWFLSRVAIPDAHSGINFQNCLTNSRHTGVTWNLIVVNTFVSIPEICAACEENIVYILWSFCFQILEHLTLIEAIWYHSRTVLVYMCVLSQEFGSQRFSFVFQKSFSKNLKQKCFYFHANPNRHFQSRFYWTASRICTLMCCTWQKRQWRILFLYTAEAATRYTDSVDACFCSRRFDWFKSSVESAQIRFPQMLPWGNMSLKDAQNLPGACFWNMCRNLNTFQMMASRTPTYMCMFPHCGTSYCTFPAGFNFFKSTVC